jgi:hypothetical protein
VRIVCLGWGSLIWKPAGLPVEGPWHVDGPALPIEFSRVGDSGELATALCINAGPVPVLWAWLDTPSLVDACAALKAREGIPAEREGGIGCLVLDNDATGVVSEWARHRDIEAVIWTNLPPRIHDIEGKVPTCNDALRYLTSLTGDVHDHARTYIETVPAQIDTPYRHAIVQAMGWT